MKYKTLSDGNTIVLKDYSKRIIFTNDDFIDKKHVLQIVTIPPQTKQRMHYHKKQTEVFYVIEGETVININGKDYVSKPGDAFICEPNDRHYLWNTSDKEFKLIVFKINKDKDSDDIEWVEG